MASRKPRSRKLNFRSLTLAAAGPEKPYPVYTFSNRTFLEKPKHNPFEGL